MKIYRVDWRAAGILQILVCLWIVTELLSPGKHANSTEVTLVFGLFFFLLIVFSYTFTSTTIKGTTLKYVELLFKRHTVDISTITEINEQPTYKIAHSQFRSLYVYYTNKEGQTKWLEYRITIYPVKSLGHMINDLVAINPKIELDVDAKKLAEKYR